VSQFRDAYGEFRRLEVEVSTVSVDSPYAHRVWARQLGIGFPMISDFDRDFLKKYDAFGPDVPFLPGIAGYHAFVVDPAGILRYVWYQPKGGGPSPIDEVLATARELEASS
jgi:peroxiredoxin